MIRLLPLAILAAAPFAAMAESHMPAETASADILGAEGDTIGEATLTQGPKGVLLHVRVEGLAPGKHGLHLHATAVCDPAEGFKTSGGHVGKIEGGHGLLNMDGPEDGDLPNLYVNADGTGEMEAYTTMVTVKGLMDEDGSALVIHEGGDDGVTQPIGGAGARVGCAAIGG
ncbi:superoxide dismutase family protein [Sagittula salina]|uniref:Superoxide dismutase [Cu-Zn] n=1 Tax=Sagittula salina TaxID=2820268 RepID=A0A940MKL1_9RHOB|nr:superoxide dismutase family protein [Sagittula salina]MBP0481318.1 superoxide dismutase family protein [Sagittula salina]